MHQGLEKYFFYPVKEWESYHKEQKRYWHILPFFLYFGINIFHIFDFLIDNTKRLNQAVAKRKSIEAEIIDVKLNTFDEIIDEKTAAQTLTLK